MSELHIDNCQCQFSHKDCVTAEGIKNIATYEIDYCCYMNGVRAGTGTMWRIKETLE